MFYESKQNYITCSGIPNMGVGKCVLYNFLFLFYIAHDKIKNIEL